MRPSNVVLILSDEHTRRALGCYVYSANAIYMLRTGRWKYVHYVGDRPQLFDLERDPDETREGRPAPSAGGGRRRGPDPRRRGQSSVHARAVAIPAGRGTPLRYSDGVA